MTYWRDKRKAREAVPMDGCGVRPTTPRPGPHYVQNRKNAEEKALRDRVAELEASMMEISLIVGDVLVRGLTGDTETRADKINEHIGRLNRIFQSAGGMKR